MHEVLLTLRHGCITGVSKETPASTPGAFLRDVTGGSSYEADLEGQKALAREKGRLLALER